MASRLSQMQMRFQQKQVQEREQRRIEMTEGEGSGDTSVAAARSAKNVANGKVRQMFDERRRGAGIDRGNPLKPLAATTTTLSTSSTALHKTTTTRTANATTIKKSPNTTNTTKRPAVPMNRTMKRSETFEQSNANVAARSGHNFDELDCLENETFPKEFSSLSLNERISSSDRNNNNQSNISNETAYGRVKSSNSIKLNPVVTKKSPPVAAARVPAARQAPPKVNKATPAVLSNRAAPGKASSTANKIPPQSSGGKMANNKMGVRPPPRITPPQPGMATCRFCSRNFNEDRLEKHEQVCQKMVNSRRKIFDAFKHRVQGTEAEKYVKKATRSNTSRLSVTGHSSSTANYGKSAVTPGSPQFSPKKNNWRQKHEEFIAAIRAAKQVQAHLAKGGKLSDLPPPPPSENPDYVQCPHCSRRFNQAAAERHIPKCATMLHNKPKPGSGIKKR